MQMELTSFLTSLLLTWCKDYFVEIHNTSVTAESELSFTLLMESLFSGITSVIQKILCKMVYWENLGQFHVEISLNKR